MLLKISILVAVLLLIRLFIIKVMIPLVKKEEIVATDELSELEKRAKETADEKTDILNQTVKKQKTINKIKNQLN